MRKIKIKQLVLMTFLILSLSCCDGKKVKKDPTTPSIQVGINEKIKTPIFNYSDYVDSVKYVNLEVSDSCLIGNVSGIRLVNNRLYISDKSSVFIFGVEGNFINKVSRKGRGHGEYLSLSQFDVNSSNGEISIYDVGKRCINVYSENGDFLRKLDIDGLPREFAVFTNGDYLLYTPDFMKETYHGVWKISKDGEFIKQLLFLDDKIQFSVLGGRSFVHINDSIIGLIGTEGLDQIIHFTQDEINVAYYIDVDREIPKEVLKNRTLGEEKTKGIAYSKSGYVETDNYLSFCVWDFGVKQVYTYYDKKTGMTYQRTDVVNESVMDPFYTGEKIPLYVPEFISDHGVVIGMMQADWIFKNSLYQQYYPGITSDSNPAICLYYMK